MAEARLKSAARIEVKAPAKIRAGNELELEVVVQNVGAGHNLPTGVTELRRMWIDVEIVDAAGKPVFRSGGLDEHGALRPDTIWFGAEAVDRAGKPTIRPWEMTKLARKQTIPPRESAHSTIKAKLPAGLSGPITVEAKLVYQSALPSVVREVMGQDAITPRIVEMGRARAVVAVE